MITIYLLPTILSLAHGGFGSPFLGGGPLEVRPFPGLTERDTLSVIRGAVAGSLLRRETSEATLSEESSFSRAWKDAVLFEYGV